MLMQAPQASATESLIMTQKVKQLRTDFTAQKLFVAVNSFDSFLSRLRPINLKESDKLVNNWMKAL